MQEPQPGESRRLTDCLHALSGDTDDDTAALVYIELRKIVQHVLQNDRKQFGRSADLRNVTTAIHDCWLRLQTRTKPWDSRAHFFGAASITVRRLLVEEARRRRHEQRRLESVDHGGTPAPEYVVRIDDLLRELAALAPRPAAVVSYRLFGDLATDVVAEIEGVSERTIQRDLAFAEAWLKARLADE